MTMPIDPTRYTPWNIAPSAIHGVTVGRVMKLRPWS